MRVVFFILISFYSISGSIAQEDYTFNSLYRTLEEGQSYFVLNRESAVYSAPDTTALLLKLLNTGTEVYVEERMDELLKKRGFRTNWYRIRFEQNGLMEEGYIWGGAIAVAAFKGGSNKERLFLYGIHSIKLVNRGDYEEESIQLQLSCCQKENVRANLIFEAMGTLYTQTQGKAYGTQGVKGVEEVIEVAFSDGYCGGVAASVTIFWDGQKLHYINLLSNGMGNEHFSNRFYIYPQEHLQSPSILILREETGQINAQKQIHYHSQIEKKFIWNGQKLEAIE